MKFDIQRYFSLYFFIHFILNYVNIALYYSMRYQNKHV